jgi:hypothetical protein
MVSTLGLTRSNGSVSHAGNSTTSPAGMYCTRSSYSWPASVPVGQATTSGRLPPSWASAGDRDGAPADFGHGDEAAAGRPTACVSAG